jgi:hypothetical protein
VECGIAAAIKKCRQLSAASDSVIKSEVFLMWRVEEVVALALSCWVVGQWRFTTLPEKDSCEFH